MGQSLVQIYTHIIFSTKQRKNFLSTRSIQVEMHAYLASILKTYHSKPIIINGTKNHVHIFCKLSTTDTLSKTICELKRNSSKWIKTKNEQYHDFQWQNGYGAFSVSHSFIERVKKYILNQEIHHKKLSYKEELMLFLREQKMNFDEKFLWHD